jgi:hypothetical protein
MIIGISGKIGSGKDTLAQLLLKECEKYFHELKVEQKSYAYKLKYITSFLTGTTLEENFDREGKNKFLPEWGMTIGEIQQRLGTEGVRKGVHEEGWVLALFADYKPSEHLWIVSDVRFKNEAEAVKSRGGFLIRLEGDPVGARANSKRDHSHPSETDLDNYNGFDIIYDNSKGIKELERLASEIAKGIRLWYV